MRLILLGPPGSGKGTSARKLAEVYKVKKVVASDLLKIEAKNGSPDGKLIMERINSGNLVPDEIVNRVVLSYLKNLDGYILDGYPRTIGQAEMLENKLDEHAVKIDKVVYLDVSLDVALKRNSARMTCPGCGFSPPAGSKKCSVCGSVLEKRADDGGNTIKHRFQTYLNLTKPLIDYYGKKGILFRVDASATIEEVSKSILDGLI